MAALRQTPVVPKILAGRYAADASKPNRRRSSMPFRAKQTNGLARQPSSAHGKYARSACAPCLLQASSATTCGHLPEQGAAQASRPPPVDLAVGGLHG